MSTATAGLMNCFILPRPLSSRFMSQMSDFLIFKRFGARDLQFVEPAFIVERVSFVVDSSGVSVFTYRHAFCFAGPAALDWFSATRWPANQ
eukprot:m.542914 g.542914  ORF g.542914 m.542914 type:complete len:91 (+) comp57664_c0_seq3:1319-1591(+)